MPPFRPSLSLLSEASMLNLRNATHFPLPFHVGTDICSVPRIVRLLSNPARAERFVKRIMSPQDSSYSGTLQRIKMWADAEAVVAAEDQADDYEKGRQQFLETALDGSGPADKGEVETQEIEKSNTKESRFQGRYYGSPAKARLAAIKFRNTYRLTDFVAGRFAAKEAVIKAHPHRRLTWHEIVISKAVPPGMADPRKGRHVEATPEQSLDGTQGDNPVDAGSSGASLTEEQDAETPTEPALEGEEEDDLADLDAGSGPDRVDRFLDQRAVEHMPFPVFATVRGWFRTGPRVGQLAWEQQARVSISHDAGYATAICIGHFDDGRLTRMMRAAPNRGDAGAWFEKKAQRVTASPYQARHIV